MSCEIEEIADLEAVRNEWSDLCDRCPAATPFQRPEWLLAWWRAFPPGEPRVLSIRRAGRLAGLAPFLVYPNEGKRTLAFCGGGVSDYLDILIDPAEETGALAALANWLEAHRDLWETCDFEPLPPESPLLRMPLPPGCAEATEPRDVCPVLTLPATVDELRGVVPTRQLSNLRKYRRKIEALGEVRLETGPLETLERLYAARWTEKGRADLAGNVAIRNLVREAAAGFAARGALAIHVLCLNGEPLAALLAFRERDTLYLYRQGSDPSWAKLSPGVLVVGATVEDAIRRGIRHLDFLRGQEPYKYWWGARDRTTWRKRYFWKAPTRTPPQPLTGE
jgi:CelD/BcsL family acetyltransferase involved in cellulose biosynthesis